MLVGLCVCKVVTELILAKVQQERVETIFILFL